MGSGGCTHKAGVFGLYILLAVWLTGDPLAHTQFI